MNIIVLCMWYEEGEYAEHVDSLAFMRCCVSTANVPLAAAFPGHPSLGWVGSEPHHRSRCTARLVVYLPVTKAPMLWDSVLKSSYPKLPRVDTILQSCQSVSQRLKALWSTRTRAVSVVWCSAKLWSLSLQRPSVSRVLTDYSCGLAGVKTKLVDARLSVHEACTKHLQTVDSAAETAEN